MRLVIIHHDRHDPRQIEEYYIHAMAAKWVERGIDVCHVAGTRHLPPGDLALVHVDLSVVPERFLRAAARYPVVLNGKIRDIRKTSLPGRNHVLASPTDLDGPVMVKTNLNNAGVPESNAYRKGGARLPLLEHWALFQGHRLGRTLAYRIYDSPRAVPRHLWKNRDFVVERFLQEKENDTFVVRTAYFLGTVQAGFKLIGPDPVLRWHQKLVEETCAIDPEVIAYRDRIHLDYGTIDYILREGKPVILDVNKTVGGPTASLLDNPLTHSLAAGIPSIG
ncbi:MAG: hypothetical protein SFU85_09540 [Candidatus Methylacidiphilales bacterium]|nr:hypothetical protein [Candidatus Methylacidiphilales bacterium]